MIPRGGSRGPAAAARRLNPAAEEMLRQLQGEAFAPPNSGYVRDVVGTAAEDARAAGEEAAAAARDATHRAASAVRRTVDGAGLGRGRCSRSHTAGCRVSR